MTLYVFTVGLALIAAVLLKLWRHGLFRRYPAFVAALCFMLVSGCVLRLIPIRTNAYALTYMATQVIAWTLRFFVLRELSRLILVDHRGIREAVRIGMWISLALATLIPCGIAVSMQINSAARFPWLQAYFLLHQSVTTFFAILVVGTLAFLAWFPVRLRRNLLVYCLGFSLQYLAQSAAILVFNLTESDSIRSAAGVADQVVTAGVLLIWLVKLSREGELPMVSIGHRWNPSAADQSLRQLAELNDTLTKALGKER